LLSFSVIKLRPTKLRNSSSVFPLLPIIVNFSIAFTPPVRGREMFARPATFPAPHPLPLFLEPFFVAPKLLKQYIYDFPFPPLLPHFPLSTTAATLCALCCQGPLLRRDSANSTKGRSRLICGRSLGLSSITCSVCTVRLSVLPPLPCHPMMSSLRCTHHCRRLLATFLLSKAARHFAITESLGSLPILEAVRKHDSTAEPMALKDLSFHRAVYTPMTFPFCRCVRCSPV